MEVQNYKRFLPADDSINVNDLCCKWPFRMSVIGPSGCGKTNMIVDMILNHIFFDDIYVLAGDIEEDLYQFLFKKLSNINEILDETDEGLLKKGIHFSNELNLDIDALDKSRQSLIIIDDFITKTDQGTAEQLFIRGRKKNASTIYISQAYFKIPKLIRDNSSYFAIFKIANRREISAIAVNHSTQIDYDDFIRLYREIHKQPYHFMLIDNVSEYPQLHIRDCWDGICLDVNAGI